MQHIGDLSEILETTEPTKVASGFIFTEGPLWHPDDFWYFVDIRQNKLLRLVIGSDPELVRETKGGNGNTFDLEGRLINCEGLARRVTRTNQDGSVETIASAFQGGRLARPNDAICHSNGDIYFTDPDQRVAFHEREIPGRDGIDGKWIGSGVYRLSADGELSLVVQCEYPNGLAFSPDEKRLYVANTRTCKFIHAIDLDGDGNMIRRSIFADMNEGDEPGIPDGLKVDSLGRVYCTGPGGIWVFEPDGSRIGVIRWPEQAVNFAFGGANQQTLLCCAHTGVYTLRVKTPGNPHPWYKLYPGN